jgi:hypothetical protein
VDSGWQLLSLAAFGDAALNPPREPHSAGDMLEDVFDRLPPVQLRVRRARDASEPAGNHILLNRKTGAAF